MTHNINCSVWCRSIPEGWNENEQNALKYNLNGGLLNEYFINGIQNR